MINILCVGRLGEHKGQGWLLDVYQQARQSFTRACRLILVGRDEGGEASLRGAVTAAGLDGEVVFTGELSDEDLARQYGEADIFVLFSQYEAFGLVYFEAMIAGVPVLTHDVGANRELLTRGAVVVPRFAFNDAAAELARLVNDSEHRSTLGQDAREYALSEFTWEAVSGKYLDLYRSAA